MGCPGGGSTNWCAASARCRRRCAPAGPPASTASTASAAQDADGAPDQRLRAGPGTGVRPRAGARHRRLGARRPRAAHRAPAAGVERAGRRGPRVLPAPDRARQRGPDIGGRGAPSDRPAARAGQRDQQVGRHRGDAGPVPGGPPLARRGAGERGQPASRCSPPTRRRARSASWPRARGSPRSRCRPTSAAGSACSRRWGSCPRRWSASTSRRCVEGAARGRGPRRERRPAPQPGRALRRAPLDGRHPGRAPGSTC